MSCAPLQEEKVSEAERELNKRQRRMEAVRGGYETPKDHTPQLPKSRLSRPALYAGGEGERGGARAEQGAAVRGGCARGL